MDLLGACFFIVNGRDIAACLTQRAPHSTEGMVARHRDHRYHQGVPTHTTNTLSHTRSTPRSQHPGHNTPVTTPRSNRLFTNEVPHTSIAHPKVIKANIHPPIPLRLVALVVVACAIMGSGKKKKHGRGQSRQMREMKELRSSFETGRGATTKNEMSRPSCNITPWYIS